MSLALDTISFVRVAVLDCEGAFFCLSVVDLFEMNSTTNIGKYLPGVFDPLVDFFTPTVLISAFPVLAPFQEMVSVLLFVGVSCLILRVILQIKHLISNSPSKIPLLHSSGRSATFHLND
jgi:uncharacterized protein YggT (Ycf19 family)